MEAVPAYVAPRAAGVRICPSQMHVNSPKKAIVPPVRVKTPIAPLSCLISASMHRADHSDTHFSIAFLNALMTVPTPRPQAVVRIMF